MNYGAMILLALSFVVGAAGSCGGSILQAQETKDSPRTTEKADDGRNDPEVEDASKESSGTWKWMLGIILTAIISPIVVKAAENHLTRDRIKEKSARLHQVIKLQAARQNQGLPPDGRLTALINELTDALGDEAKGKQQALDEATSFLLGTLSSRLLEALYLSSHQVEMLLDSKHSSEALYATFDVTRLKFLQSYWGFRRASVPQYFMSIKREDVDRYASEIEESISTLGENAIKHATAIGSTESDVREFVNQIRNEISNARNREKAEHGKA